MNIQTRRKRIIERLNQVKNDAVLERLEQVLNEEQTEQEKDWWHELTPEQQQQLEEGLKQAKNGQTVSSEEVHRKIEMLLAEK